MNTSSSTPPYNTPDSPFIGYLIGVVICLVISLFHMCSTSCSRKVTELTEADSLSQVQTSVQFSENTDSITTLLSNTASHVVLSNTAWQLNFTRTHFTLPDSLGNQYVTLQESALFDFANHQQDSTLSQSTINNVQSHKSTEQSADSVYITKTKTKTKTITKTTEKPIPWYYRYSLYTLIIAILLVLLYTLYRKFQKHIPLCWILYPDEDK